MKPLKAVIKSEAKPAQNIDQFPVTNPDKARYTALKNIIIQAHLACAQPLPDAEFINALIVSWNAALRRVPTPYLEPSLQFAIESHSGIGKITCPVIYRAFRELLLRQKNAVNLALPGPRTAPPKEYYDMLAKIGIFPKPVAAPEKPKFKKPRPQHQIAKREGQCHCCGARVKILVIYQDNKQSCLDCAIRAEIVKESK